MLFPTFWTISRTFCVLNDNTTGTKLSVAKDRWKAWSRTPLTGWARIWRSAVYDNVRILSRWPRTVNPLILSFCSVLWITERTKHSVDHVKSFGCCGDGHINQRPRVGHPRNNMRSSYTSSWTTGISTLNRHCHLVAVGLRRSCVSCRDACVGNWVMTCHR